MRPLHRCTCDAMYVPEGHVAEHVWHDCELYTVEPEHGMPTMFCMSTHDALQSTQSLGLMLVAVPAGSHLTCNKK